MADLSGRGFSGGSPSFAFKTPGRGRLKWKQKNIRLKLTLIFILSLEKNKGRPLFIKRLPDCDLELAQLLLINQGSTGDDKYDFECPSALQICAVFV